MKWPIVEFHGYRIRLLGDPILNEPCKPVEFGEFTRAAILPEHLLVGMRMVCTSSHFGLPHGVGITANQVGASLRMCVALVRLTPDAEHPTLTTLVNPQIVAKSAETKWMNEGCLSIPYFRRGMKRHVGITVEYRDLDGTPQPPLKLEGFEAEILQHELDHMNGITIADGCTRQQLRQAQRLVAELEV